MNFDIAAIPSFKRSLKALAKRHRSLKEDFASFVKELSGNPMQGDELSPGIRKIRMAITSKGRGKSGGARVITYTIFTSVETGKVYLIDIYDKADYSTVDVEVIKVLVKKLEDEKNKDFFG